MAFINSANIENDPCKPITNIVIFTEKVIRKVEKVIHNKPATIIFWSDGEKTVVKCRECGDGKCIFDKRSNIEKLDGKIVEIENVSDAKEKLSTIARNEFCDLHYDEEKAIMAAMLKRLYPNFQDVLRKANV